MACAYYLTKHLLPVLANVVIEYIPSRVYFEVRTLGWLLEEMEEIAYTQKTRLCINGNPHSVPVRISATANHHLSISMNEQDRQVSNVYLDDRCPHCELGTFCTHNPRLVLPRGEVKAADFYLMLKECTEPNIALVGCCCGSRIKTMRTRIYLQEEPLVKSPTDTRKDRQTILCVDYDVDQDMVILWGMRRNVRVGQNLL